MNDADLIKQLGGPTAVAREMSRLRPSDQPVSVQRVSNWITRGIPPGVKLAYPSLFLNPQLAPVEERQAA